MNKALPIERESVQEKESELLLEKVDQSLVKSDLLNRNLTTPQQVAEHYDLTLEQAKRIVADPEFLLDFKAVEKASLRVEFYISACSRLMEIIKTEKPRTAIMATKLLASILGETEGKPLVQIQNNTQNNCFESKLAEAHRLLSERKVIAARQTEGES
ncbi:hypothetical protein L0244_19945 [bacterium]|nr:hypothetical protein [bacterium]